MTTRLVMRRPIESDMPPIIEPANDWEVARRLGRLPHPDGIVDARFFLDEVVPNELVWAITLRGEGLFMGGALPGSLRHSVGGRDPQEGDDEDADNSFERRGFGPRWADVAPAQARCGGTPVAGGGSGDPLAGARRHRRDSDGMAGHLCGGR